MFGRAQKKRKGPLFFIETGMPVVVRTKQESRFFCGSRGAISLEGAYFMWASKDGVQYRSRGEPSDQNWFFASGIS